MSAMQPSLSLRYSGAHRAVKTRAYMARANAVETGGAGPSRLSCPAHSSCTTAAPGGGQRGDMEAEGGLRGGGRLRTGDPATGSVGQCEHNRELRQTWRRYGGRETATRPGRAGVQGWQESPGGCRADGSYPEIPVARRSRHGEHSIGDRLQPAIGIRASARKECRHQGSDQQEPSYRPAYDLSGYSASQRCHPPFCQVSTA